jgi:bacterioferritin
LKIFFHGHLFIFSANNKNKGALIMGKNTKAILEIDVKTVIKELNKALADEFLATHQYLIGSKIVKGFYRTEVQKELEEHSKEEHEHALKIIDRIIQLDGIPILDPKDWYKFTTCNYLVPKKFNSVAILNQNLKGERCAIDVYKNLLKKLEHKDIITYHMILKILEEEIEHECDLENLLEDIRLSR